MTTPLPAETKSELHHLLSGLCDGKLSDTDRSKLETMVLDDDRAREFYVEYIHLHAAVVRYNLADEPSPQSVGIATKQHPPMLSMLSGERPPSERKPVLIFAIIAIAFYGSFAMLVWTMGQSGRYMNGVLDGPGLATEATLPPSIAKLTGDNGCLWRAEKSRGPAPVLGSELAAGRELLLEKGLAEITFLDGAKLILEGPAAVELQELGHLRLQFGQVVARVPQLAIGFTVETREVTVVDLGTEFGIVCDKTGRSDVQVFTGAVDVHFVAVGSTSPATMKLLAGHSQRFARTDGQTGVTPGEIVGASGRFARALSGSTPPRPPETEYAAAVLASRPVAYWRLSDSESATATDATGNGHHGSYYGGVHPNQPGLRPETSDRSIRVLGSVGGSSMDVEHLPIAASFTLELWGRSATPIWNTFGWLASARFANGLLLHPDMETRGWSGYVYDAAGNYHPIGVHGPAAIDDRFHQYVISYDAPTDTGAMYFDGTLVASKTPLLEGAKRDEVGDVALSVGRDPMHDVAGFGDGAIDEVALYDRALSPEDIAAHYREATNQ